MDPYVAYEAAGSGQPIVLVHAYGMWGAWWRACGYVDALERAGFRSIVLDVPGHGRSAKSHDPADYAMDRVVDGIMSVVDREGVESFVAWGLGTGGTITQALIHSGRVTHAVVGACALGLPREIYDAWAVPFRDQARAGDWTLLEERLGSEPMNGLEPVRSVNDPDALEAFLTGNPWGTTTDELRASGVPIVAYHGEEDPAVGFGEPQAEQAGATFFTVPGGIRESYVNAEPVLQGVLPALGR